MKDLRNKILGQKGEQLAVEYLKKQGYKILEHNFLKRYTELDIVALDGDTLAFIEVKTRTSNRFGTPIESITPWKLKALVRSCQYYKSLHSELPEAMRIDVVSVNLSPGGGVEKIELTKNITG